MAKITDAALPALIPGDSAGSYAQVQRLAQTAIAGSQQHPAEQYGKNLTGKRNRGKPQRDSYLGQKPCQASHAQGQTDFLCHAELASPPEGAISPVPVPVSISIYRHFTPCIITQLRLPL